MICECANSLALPKRRFQHYYLAQRKYEDMAKLSADPGEPSSRPALYYPYIHIRSERWLKATLLCAPTVKRIVPETYDPEDSQEIAKYTKIAGPHGLLLQAMPAYSNAADQAQMRMLRQIEQHLSDIRDKYGREKAPLRDEYWIHDAKFSETLLRFLIDHNLAWPSGDPHDRTYGQRTWYALHPVLGSAVMTTLGLSIAQEQHYDVVTPSSEFHETLLSTKEEGIFAALLNPLPSISPTSAQRRNDLGQLVVSLTGVNYQALRPEDIPEIQASKHFAAFQKMIRQTAYTINPDLDAEEYKENLTDAAGKIIDAWHATQRDVGSGIRKALSASAYTLSGSALTTYLTHADVQHALVGAGVGIGVRFLETGVDLVRRWRKPRPYQYLSEIVEAQNEMLRLTFPLGLEAPNPASK